MLTLALPLVALTMTGGATAAVGALPPLRLPAPETEKSWSGSSGARSPDLATLAAAISERAANGPRPPRTTGGGHQPGGLEPANREMPRGTKGVR